MSKIRTFEDLDVWQMGSNLTLKIYEITGHFPKEEIYGMTSQIKRVAHDQVRRRAVSSMSNLSFNFFGGGLIR